MYLERQSALRTEKSQVCGHSFHFGLSKLIWKTQKFLLAIHPEQDGKGGAWSIHLYTLERLQVTKAVKTIHWEDGCIPEMCKRHPKFPLTSSSTFECLISFSLLTANTLNFADWHHSYLKLFKLFYFVCTWQHSKSVSFIHWLTWK